MAPSSDSWLLATTRVLLKRVAVLEQELLVFRTCAALATCPVRQHVPDPPKPPGIQDVNLLKLTAPAVDHEDFSANLDEEDLAEYYEHLIEEFSKSAPSATSTAPCAPLPTSTASTACASLRSSHAPLHQEPAPVKNVRFEDEEGFDLSASLSSTSTSPCAPSSSVAKSLPSPTSTAPCAPSSSMLISTTVSSTSVDADVQDDMKKIINYGRNSARISAVSQRLIRKGQEDAKDDDSSDFDEHSFRPPWAIWPGH